MRNLHKLDIITLIDMLAEHTLKFTHLFRVNKGLYPNKEYKDTKQAIEKIMMELESRGMLPKHIDPFMLNKEKQQLPAK